jgi:hypothetical protein
LEDQRISRIRELLEHATKLQDAATQLIADLTDQIQRSIFIHDDRGGPKERRRYHERRKKPRP